MEQVLSKSVRKHKGVYGYIEEKDKVLLIVKKRGPYTNLYDLPGGAPEKGEIDIETLAREVEEETGCLLKECFFKFEETVTYENFFEENGEAGCLSHHGIVFDCITEGCPDYSISVEDSNGPVWVAKKDISPDNSTPFVLMCVDKYNS